MNVRKKRKLAILFILLCLNLLALTFYTFRAISSSNLSLQKSYPFLKHFSKKKTNIFSSTYGAESIIYNIKIDDDDIIFDLNTLDSKENGYIDKLKLPATAIEDFEYVKENFQKRNIYTAQISIKFKRKSIFSQMHIDTWSMREITFTPEDLERINTGILETLKEAKIDKENTDGFEKYSNYFYTENGKTLGSISNVTSEILYRPLLWSYERDSKTEDIVKYLTDFYDYRGESLAKNTKDSKVENIAPFSCSMLEKIITNKNIEGEQRNVLLNKYCSYNDLVEAKNRRLSDKFNPGTYNTNSLINSIGYSRILSAKEEKFPLAFDWYISLYSDIQSAERLYNRKIGVDKEDILGRISSGIISNNTFTLRNICNITEYVSNEEFRNRVFNLFKSNIEEGLRLIDTDIFSSLHCMNTVKDDSYVKAILFKIYRQNFENRGGITGLWSNDRYMVEGNSIFLILLKNSYEEI